MKNIKRLTSLSLSLLMIATSTLPGLPNALAAEKKTSRIIQLEQQKNEAAQNTEELEKTDSHSQESESQQQPEEESNQIILNEDGSINAENASYSSNPGTPAHIDPDPLVKLRSTNAAELTNFEPSLFTGAFNYSFPLDLPPGRNGFGPSLGLNYSSQDRSLSSQVAFGWSMPEVSISRQAKEGINNLYTNKKHFTYTIGSSGGELVPLTISSGEYGTYGARVESAFYTFEYLSNGSWQITNTEGTIYQLGTTAAFRQDNPQNSSQIYKWMVERINDTDNNLIRYEYFKDSGQIYPKRIVYTGNGGADGIFQVKVLPFANGNTNGAGRAYPSSSYQSGFKVETRYRVTGIETTVSGTKRMEYGFEVNGNSDMAKEYLSRITQTGYDQTGNATVAEPTEFDYTNQVQTVDETAGVPSGLPYFVDTRDPVSTPPHDESLVDINGDGRADMFYYAMDSYGRLHFSVGINNGSGFTSAPSYSIMQSTTYGFQRRGKPFRVADVNGDGLADLILSAGASSGSGVSGVYLNTGTGWGSLSSWYIPFTFTWPYNIGMSHFQVEFQDVNGDGLPDLIHAYATPFWGVQVYLHTGSGWSSAPVSYNIAVGSDFVAYNIPISQDHISIRFGDLNGDGLVDTNIQIFQPTGFSNTYGRNWPCSGSCSKTYLNTGASWDTPVNGGTSQDAWVTEFFMDYEKKGFDELVTTNIYHQIGSTSFRAFDIRYFGSSQALFRSSPLVQAIYPAPKSVAYRFGDVNADGFTDIILSHTNGTGSEQRFFSSSGTPRGMLKQITTGQGSTVDITYKASSAYIDNGAYANPNLPNVTQTVNTVTVSDPHGTLSQNTYNYAKGHFYSNTATKDAQFAGFGKVSVTNALGEKTVNYFHQSQTSQNYSSLGEYQDHFSKKGNLFRQEIYNAQNVLKKRVTTKIENSALSGTERYFVRSSNTVTTIFDGSTQTSTASESAYNSTNGQLQTGTNRGYVTAQNNGTFSDTGTDTISTHYEYATPQTSGLHRLVFAKRIITKNHLNQIIGKTEADFDNLANGVVGKGHMTATRTWYNSARILSKSYIYNSHGLLESATNARGKTTTYGYDPQFLYPRTISNALSQSTTYSVDYALGQITQETDPNAAITKTTFDGLGRQTKTEVTNPLSTNQFITLGEQAYDTSTFPQTVTSTQYFDTGKSRQSVTFLDGLGRSIQTKTQDSTSGIIVTSTAYDQQGRVLKKDLPIAGPNFTIYTPPNAQSPGSTFTYDTLNRVITETTSISTTTNAYNGSTVTTTVSPGSFTKELITNAYGRLITVREHNEGATYTTSYQWSPLGYLTKITDAENNIRNFSYNWLGWMESQEDLHQQSDTNFGTHTYEYDDNGNRKKHVDPNGNDTRYTYDDIDRLDTQNLWGNGIMDVDYNYDTGANGVGRLREIRKQSSLLNRLLHLIVPQANASGPADPPTSLEVNGVQNAWNTDFTGAYIFSAIFNDPQHQRQAIGAQVQIWMGFSAVPRPGTNPLIFSSGLQTFQNPVNSGERSEPLLFDFSSLISYNQRYTVRMQFQTRDGQWSYSNIPAHAAHFTTFPANQRPVLKTPAPQTIDEGVELRIPLQVYDPNNDPFTLSFGVNAPANAIFVGNEIVWTPDFTQAGNWRFKVAAEDSFANRITAFVSITVVDVNRNPSFATISNQAGAENSALSFAVSATDPDADTISITAQNLPAGSTFINDTFLWTPSFSQAGNYTVSFSADDRRGGSALTSVDITISNLNRVPQFLPVPTQAANENQPLSFTISATDPDGEPITYSLQQPVSTPGASFDTTTRTYNWTPNYNHAGTYTVTFQAEDSSGGVGILDVSITVSNINRSPSLASVPLQRGTENSLLSFSLSSTDADGDAPIYSIESQNPITTGATLNSSTGLFEWTPNFSQSGTYGIIFKVEDGNGGEDTKAATISIANLNRPPAFTPVPQQFGDTRQQLTFPVSATDPDSDPLTITAQSLPTGATFTNNIFSWTPTRTQSGSFTATFTVSDGNGASDSLSVSITITNANRPPTINAVSPRSTNEGVQLTFTLTGADPDGDPISFQSRNLPTGATISGSRFQWTPTFTQSGTYRPEFRASDGMAQSQWRRVTITVINAAAPVASINNINTIYNYDILGRVSSITKQIGSDSFTTSSTYDRQGQPLTITQPNNNNVTYEYYPTGQAKKVSYDGTPVVGNLTYSPAGSLAQITFQNGVKTTRTYDPNKLYRLTNLKTEHLIGFTGIASANPSANTFLSRFIPKAMAYESTVNTTFATSYQSIEAMEALLVAASKKTRKEILQQKYLQQKKKAAPLPDKEGVGGRSEGKEASQAQKPRGAFTPITKPSKKAVPKVLQQAEQEKFENNCFENQPCHPERSWRKVEGGEVEGSKGEKYSTLNKNSQSKEFIGPQRDPSGAQRDPSVPQSGTSPLGRGESYSYLENAFDEGSKIEESQLSQKEINAILIKENIQGFAKKYRPGQEVIELRTETAKHFFKGVDAKGKEQFELRAYTGPIHHRDEQGKWAESAPEWENVGKQWWVKNAPFRIQTPPVISTETPFNIGLRKAYFGITPLEMRAGESTIPFNESAAEQQASDLTYSNLLPDLDLNLHLMNDTLRKDLILRSDAILQKLKSETLSFVFKLHLPETATILRSTGETWTGESLSINEPIFIRLNQTEGFTLRPPRATDAKESILPLSVRLEREGNELFLIKSMDLSTLWNANYPVRFDATFTAGNLQSSGGDGSPYRYSAQYNTRSPYTGAPPYARWNTWYNSYNAQEITETLKVGLSQYNSIDHRLYRALLPFDTTSIRATDLIQSAEVFAYLKEKDEYYDTFSMRGYMQQNIGAVITSSIQIDPLAMQPSDTIGALDLSAITGSMAGGGVGQYKSTVIGQPYFNWIQKGGYTKLGIITMDDYNYKPYGCLGSCKRELRYASSRANDPNKRPYLSVTYTATNTAPAQPTSARIEGQNASYVLTTSPQFTAVYSDVDRNDTAAGYQIQVNESRYFNLPMMWDAQGTFSTPVLTGNRISPITYAGIPLSLGGQSLYWRIRLRDQNGLWSAWSRVNNRMGTGRFRMYNQLSNRAPTAPVYLRVDDRSGSPSISHYNPTFKARFLDPNTILEYADAAQVQVIQNTGTFNSPFWDSGTRSLNPPLGFYQYNPNIRYTGPLLPANGATYRWRIRFRDDEGLWGAWSDGTNGFQRSTNPYLQNQEYTYDPMGNILTQNDYSEGGVQKKATYQYDDLSRLKQANIQNLSTNISQTLAYTYSETGNILTKTGQAGTYQYSQPGKTNPQAATRVDGRTYVYDNNGNLTNDGQYSYAWDYENNMITSTSLATQRSTEYVYNVGKERAYKKSIKARTGGPEWVESFYVSDTYEVEKDSAHPGGELQRTSIYLGSLLVAVVEEDGNGTTEINYHHQDHLGGSSVVTNSQRQIVKSQDYYPFGSSRVSTGNYDADSHGFTDQERDEETNLHYYGARYYNTDIGRFTGQDPLQMRPSELLLIRPQTLNFYSYAVNNPLKYIDPSGEVIEEAKNWLNYGVYATNEEIADHERTAIEMDQNPDQAYIISEDQKTYNDNRGSDIHMAATGPRCLLCDTSGQEGVRSYVGDPSQKDLSTMTNEELLTFRDSINNEANTSVLFVLGAAGGGNFTKAFGNMRDTTKNIMRVAKRLGITVNIERPGGPLNYIFQYGKKFFETSINRPPGKKLNSNTAKRVKGGLDGLLE